MKKIELSEKKVGWGRDVYSYDPRQYETKSKIVLEQIKNAEYYYEEKIGKILGEDMVILTLKDNMLFDLEYDANQNSALMKMNRLALFLDSLFQLEEFYIFLTREDEMVKERCRVKKRGEIIDKLTECLNWSNPKDILLYKEKI